MERIATWNRVGTDVTDCSKLDDVLGKSGLDFTVECQKIYTGDGIEIPGRVATVNRLTGDVLGVVGSKYNVCQNRDAFDFVNYISDDIKFMRAGMTSHGLIYIIGVLPTVDILGDKFTPHVIFQNGHNGGYSIKAAICPLRIVCQNQFNLSFRETSNTINIKHNGAMQSRIESAREVLAGTAKYMEVVNTEAEKLAGVKLTAAELQKFIDRMFPIKGDMTDKMKSEITTAREVFKNAYNADDNCNFRGTAWGIMNAYSDYITHRAPTRMTKNWEDTKFVYVTFTPYLNKVLETISSVRV